MAFKNSVDSWQKRKRLLRSSFIKSSKATSLWLAKWCKIHEVYIHLHSRLLLLFTNIFIHIQQLSLHSKKYICLHLTTYISYSLTFTGCVIHIQWLISVDIGRFYKHSLFVWVFVSSVKTDSRRIILLYLHLNDPQ